MTGGNEHKLKHRRLPLNIREHFVTMSVTEHWHRFLREVVEPLSLDICVPIQCRGGFDTIPRARVRCKRSQMPCSLVNFISVNRESEAGRGRQQGEETRKNERSKVEKTPVGKEKKCRGGEQVTAITDSMMSSDVRSAQSLCRRGGPGEGRVQQRGGEEESKRKRELRGACAALL